MVTKTQFHQKMTIADQAAAEITKWLQSKGWHVINVESDVKYQKKDIDLIAMKVIDPHKFPISFKIEIKGDKYYKTGNYFIETISNMNKNTPGCFLYTESDYIFYYFVDEKELHIIPTKEAQEWFIKHKDSFTKFGYPSTYNTKGKLLYKSKGTLVKRKTMQSNINIDIKHIQ